MKTVFIPNCDRSSVPKPPPLGRRTLRRSWYTINFWTRRQSSNHHQQTLCSVHLSSSHPTLDRSQCVSPRQQHNERSEPTFCRVYLTLCLYWYSRQKDFFITFTGTGTPLHTYTFLGLFLTLLSLYTSTTIYKIESWSFSTAVVSSPSFHLFAFLSTGTGRSLPFSLQCSKKIMQKHSQPVKLPNFITFGTVPPLLA